MIFRIKSTAGKQDFCGSINNRIDRIHEEKITYAIKNMIVCEKKFASFSKIDSV